MNVTITGVTGLRNRGVEALVRTAITEIIKARPDSKIAVVSSDSGFDDKLTSNQVRVIPDAPGYFRRGFLQRAVIDAIPGLARSSIGKIRSAIQASDVLVVSGGDIISADYGDGLPRRQLALVNEAMKRGKKTVFLGHSIGPFKTKAQIDLVAPVLMRCDLITARESLTRRYLIEDLKIPAEKVVLVSDVAFLLEPTASEPRRAMARSLGLSGEQTYVALAPSEGITSFSDARDREAHDRAWTDTIEYVLSNTEHSVLLVPHVQDLKPANNDSQIVMRLMQQLDFPDRVHAAFGPFTASDYKGLIAGAEFFVGERMHACIAALSTSVPSLVVGYSVKAQGIMADIFTGDVSGLGLMIPVGQFMDETARRAALTTLVANTSRVRDHLDTVIPAVKGMASKNFQALLEVVEG